MKSFARKSLFAVASFFTLPFAMGLPLRIAGRLMESYVFAHVFDWGAIVFLAAIAVFLAAWFLLPRDTKARDFLISLAAVFILPVAAGFLIRLMASPGWLDNWLLGLDFGLIMVLPIFALASLCLSVVAWFFSPRGSKLRYVLGCYVVIVVWYWVMLFQVTYHI
jgi:hypothetical protein